MEVCYYDYRTHIHHTLKKKPMTFEHLREFVELYKTGAIHSRDETWHPDKIPEGRCAVCRLRNFSAEKKRVLMFSG